MKKKKSECDNCPIMGYSPDFCRLHRSHLAKEKKGLTSKGKGGSRQSWGVKAAVGAGVGVTGAVVGMAALPALGMHALLGHLVAAKVAGAGGALGAGANVAINYNKKSGSSRKSSK